MSKDISITKILFLASNPKGMNKLRLDEEARDIKEGLRQAKEREKFLIDSEWAVRPRDVRRAILYFKPNVVHFSGHGSEDGGLAFENEFGKVHLVSPEALSGLFKLLTSHVDCVVLNACYSKKQADAIARHIDFVIGMSQEIGDQAAIEFSVGFYDALAAGCSVEMSYSFGCNAIQIAGIEESLTPILKKKSDCIDSIALSLDNSNLKISESKFQNSSTRLATLSSLNVRYEFVMSGNVEEVDRQKLDVIVMHLRQVTGDMTLTLLKVESGSIKLLLEGTLEGYELREKHVNKSPRVVRLILVDNSSVQRC